MRFYTLKLKLWDDKITDEKLNSPKVYPAANGSRIVNSEGYLEVGGRINATNYVDDAPVFDYFYLYSLSNQSENDWILLDAYSFSGLNTPSIRGFLVSEKFKQVLDGFRIASPFRFYKSKLMYQGKKLDYYILQLAQYEWNEFNSEESHFYLDGEELNIEISNNGDFKKILTDFKNQRRQLTMSLKLNEFADLFFFSQYNYVVSENLRNEILRSGLKDFEFYPLDRVEFQFRII